MSEVKKYLNVNSIALALVLCLGGVSLLKGKGEAPKPEPEKPKVSLVEQVKKDLAGEPHKAEVYEGLYRAASILALRTELKPQAYFETVAKVRIMLNLSDPELKVTAEKHLAQFSDLKEWDAVSRHMFADAVRALADACKEAM